MDRRHVLSIFLGLAFGATHPAQAQEVQRVDVRESGLVGRLYAVAGASRRTGVLMLTGSGGSYPDEAAARDLARAAYPVFALAYFRDREGNPPELEPKELRDASRLTPYLSCERIEMRALAGDEHNPLGAPRGAGMLAYSPWLANRMRLPSGSRTMKVCAPHGSVLSGCANS